MDSTIDADDGLIFVIVLRKYGKISFGCVFYIFIFEHLAFIDVGFGLAAEDRVAMHLLPNIDLGLH